MHQVHVPTVDPGRLEGYIGASRMTALLDTGAELQSRLGGRSVWNVNSTASGGGVAEMLAQLVGYGLGAGVDTRWAVIEGDPTFFEVTKRLHNRLHGQAGDGGPLGADERTAYEATTSRAADELLAQAGEHDLVVLHDPQTAGMAPALAQRGCGVVWRCHIGSDKNNDETEQAWSFLQPYLDAVHHVVFSRSEYVPEVVRGHPATIVAPAIDPFSTKNADLDDETTAAILAAAGLLDGPGPNVPAAFLRGDGSTGKVSRQASVVGEGPLPTAADRVVVQVSRWDRLKDMNGVMQGFADHVVGADGVDAGAGNARLMLVGPSVEGVSDDPEGLEVWDECKATFASLAADARRRINLVCLPMDDVEENAAMVNAVQRHATVVVQKSLAEGFGLTVAEAMWKARPVVASAVGGIQDQVVDGEHGVLLSDPADLAAFGAALVQLLSDPAGAAQCGDAAREQVRTHFLPDRQLTDWARVLTAVDDGLAR
ncbi:MAG: glycosyltransferase [Actinomycetes bacterium]